MFLQNGRCYLAGAVSGQRCSLNNKGEHRFMAEINFELVI